MKKLKKKMYWGMILIVSLYCSIEENDLKNVWMYILVFAALFFFAQLLLKTAFSTLKGDMLNTFGMGHRGSKNNKSILRPFASSTQRDKEIANNIYESIKFSEEQSRMNAQKAEASRAQKNAQAASYFQGQANKQYGTNAGREAQRKADRAKNNRYY